MPTYVEWNRRTIAGGKSAQTTAPTKAIRQSSPVTLAGGCLGAQRSGKKGRGIITQSLSPTARDDQRVNDHFCHASRVGFVATMVRKSGDLQLIPRADRLLRVFYQPSGKPRRLRHADCLDKYCGCQGVGRGAVARRSPMRPVRLPG